MLLAIGTVAVGFIYTVMMIWSENSNNNHD